MYAASELGEVSAALKASLLTFPRACAKVTVAARRRRGGAELEEVGGSCG
jgi:hypothetical protein